MGRSRTAKRRPGSTVTGCLHTDRAISAHRQTRTPSIAFRHLPPNSARFSYATEGALFISAQLSTGTVSALQRYAIFSNDKLDL